MALISGSCCLIVFFARKGVKDGRDVFLGTTLGVLMGFGGGGVLFVFVGGVVLGVFNRGEDLDFCFVSHTPQCQLPILLIYTTNLPWGTFWRGGSLQKVCNARSQPSQNMR